MKTTITQIIFLTIFLTNLYSQTRSIEAESSVVTNHFVTVNGIKIPYSATAGTLPVWSEDDKAVATLFYTYYKRTDVKDVKNRPIFISFNGGPGAASIWMHMGYTSPRTLNIDDEGFPIQPYGIQDNPYSIIDVADIVYVNPRKGNTYSIKWFYFVVLFNNNVINLYITILYSILNLISRCSWDFINKKFINS